MRRKTITGSELTTIAGSNFNSPLLGLTEMNHYTIKEEKLGYLCLVNIIMAAAIATILSRTNKHP